MNQIIDKNKIHQICLRMIQTKIAETQSAISAAGTSAQTETKSTAGDKHDTARAMAHLEQEKYASVLAQQKATEDLLLRINPAKVSVVAGTGSVVATSLGTFYIGAPLGKCDAGEMEIFAVSASSPLAVAIRGLKAGDSFTMAGQSHLINAIF